MNALLSLVVKTVLDYVLGKLTAWAQGIAARLKRHKEIDKGAEESVQPGKDAKTDKEQEDALKDSIGSGW